MAMTPPTTSSTMTPQPAGSQFSEALTGQGFRMSKKRKRTKAHSMSVHEKAKGRMAIQAPTSSSITTSPGSFLSSSSSARVAAREPATKRRASRKSRPARPSGRKRKGASTRASKVPQVPGAQGERPAGPSLQKESTSLLLSMAFSPALQEGA